MKWCVSYCQLLFREAGNKVSEKVREALIGFNFKEFKEQRKLQMINRYLIKQDKHEGNRWRQKNNGKKIHKSCSVVWIFYFKYFLTNPKNVIFCIMSH